MQRSPSFKIILASSLVIRPTVFPTISQSINNYPLIIGSGKEKGNKHLLPTKNQPLLSRRNPLLLLDPLLDTKDFIIWFNIQFDFLAGEGANSALR